ncbi:hypothetical protein BD779DRAFT_1417247, partial [Infundibulicybe gibba]
DFSEQRPSAYATDKLERKEYVEIWYFTWEGCEDASKQRFSTPQDVLSMARDGDDLKLRPLAATRASRNALPDRALSWDQVFLGSKLLITHMTRTGWPRGHIETLSRFFVELDFIRAGKYRGYEHVIIEY